MLCLTRQENKFKDNNCGMAVHQEHYCTNE
jgi:hypothetical protein